MNARVLFWAHKYLFLTQLLFFKFKNLGMSGSTLVMPLLVS